jgi:hypothetical protein
MINTMDEISLYILLVSIELAPNHPPVPAGDSCTLYSIPQVKPIPVGVKIVLDYNVLCCVDQA